MKLIWLAKKQLKINLWKLKILDSFYRKLYHMQSTTNKWIMNLMKLGRWFSLLLCIIYVWIAKYFGTYDLDDKASPSPRTVKFSGLGQAKSFEVDNAYKLISSGRVSAIILVPSIKLKILSLIMANYHKLTLLILLAFVQAMCATTARIILSYNYCLIDLLDRWFSPKHPCLPFQAQRICFGFTKHAYDMKQVLMYCFLSVVLL